RVVPSLVSSRMAAKGGDAAKGDAAKPGEPPFGLKLSPEEKVLFKGKLGEPITVGRTITNTTADRQCYKIKCTANDIFRVRQPLGFIEPKESVTVKISFMGKAVPENSKVHFFAFYHTKSDKKTDGDKNPRQIWTTDAKPQGVARHHCAFEIEGAEKKEEKK
ncbi:hypothetical protein PMAYCL1PPCAC_31522, partial [Pristionchus mayeri]